eukprot:1188749-Prorocentrum_minimum.AAC.1
MLGRTCEGKWAPTCTRESDTSVAAMAPTAASALRGDAHPLNIHTVALNARSRYYNCYDTFRNRG